jgi:hypothetical protein
MAGEPAPSRSKARSHRSIHRIVVVIAGVAGGMVILLFVAILPSLIHQNRVPEDVPIDIRPSVILRNPIEAFVRERMQPASAAFFAPSPMKRGEPSETILEIAPPDIRPDQLESELRTRTAESGIAVSESIKIASRMIARLVPDRKATVTAKTAEDRAVKFGERTTWRWNVTPEVGKTLTLTATLTAPVVVDGKETGYEVKSFEQKVTVMVTTADQIWDGIDWSKEHWMILSAVGAGILAAWQWWKKRENREIDV